MCRAFQGRLLGCPGSLILLVSQEKLSFFRGGNAVPGALAQSLTRLGSDTGWAHSSEKPPSPEYERQVLQGLRCDFTHFFRSILSPPNVVLEKRVRQICPHLWPLRVVGFQSFMHREQASPFVVLPGGTSTWANDQMHGSTADTCAWDNLGSIRSNGPLVYGSHLSGVCAVRGVQKFGFCKS